MEIYKSSQGEAIVMKLYEATLSQWSVPQESLHLPTRHGDTFVIASGEKTAPPLILVHGAGTNSMMWAGDIARYSRDFRVYCVDLLGEPGKSAPNRPSWEGAAYVEWLDDALAALHVEKASFVGISQGGWTVLRYATVRPERVEKLALLTPGGLVPDNLMFLVRAIFYGITGAWGKAQMMSMLYGDQPVPQKVAAIMQTFQQHFKPRLGVLPIFTDSELRRLTMPTLLIMGTKDVLRDGDKIARRMQPLLPRLTVKHLAGVGHAIINTVDDVTQFLTSGEVELVK